jgi:hypothetical protein
MSEIELPCDVMGHPLGKKLEIIPLSRATPQSESPWVAPRSGSLTRFDAELRSIHTVDVHDILTRWHRIQTTVSRKSQAYRSGRAQTKAFCPTELELCSKVLKKAFEFLWLVHGFPCTLLL